MNATLRQGRAQRQITTRPSHQRRSESYLSHHRSTPPDPPHVRGRDRPDPKGPAKALGRVQGRTPALAKGVEPRARGPRDRASGRRRPEPKRRDPGRDAGNAARRKPERGPCAGVQGCRGAAPPGCRGAGDAAPARVQGRGPQAGSKGRSPWDGTGRGGGSENSTPATAPRTLRQHRPPPPRSAQRHADSSCRNASRNRAARSATSSGPSDTARSAHRCPSASSPRRA